MVLLEELTQQGCVVEFLDRPMSQDPHDQLLLQIRSAVAEYERTLIAERMRRGRLAKFRAGLLLPWTRPPYGYRLHPERPRDPAGVTLDAVEATVVADIFAAYLEPGASLMGVARGLHARGLPSPTGQAWWGLATLRGLLTNPTYTGQVYARRTRSRPAQIRRSATHPIGRPHDSAVPLPPEEWIPIARVPAIVTQEHFEMARAKLSRNQSFARRHNTVNTYLLRALVSCGHCQASCGARMVGSAHAGKRRHAYYICSGKAKPVLSHRTERCAARFIPASQLDALVWQDLCDVLTHPQSLTQALERAHGGHWLPHELRVRRENLRKARVSIDHQRQRLTDAYLRGVIPLDEYEHRRRDLNQKDTALGCQEDHLGAQADRQAAVAGLVTEMEEFCQRVQAGLSAATFEQKRQLVELLIDRVIVTDDHVEIHYVIPTTPESAQVRFCYLRTDYFRHPDLVEPPHLRRQQQVGVRRQLMARVRRGHPAPLALAEQGLFAHDP
jgi:site-specific DNA recombinase